MKMGILDMWKRHRLASQLHDPDPRIRIEAVEGIAEIGGSGMIDLLLNALHEPSNKGLVQARIIAALGFLRSREAIPLLLRILTDMNDSSTVVRKRAAEALGDIGDAEAVRPMMQLLCDGEQRDRIDEELAARIRSSLLEIGGRNHHPFLEALNSSDTCIRIEAIRVLGDLGRSDLIPHLRDALADRHYMIRIGAAAALGRIGGAGEIEALSSAMKDVNRDVRDAAKHAILEIRRRFQEANPPTGGGYENGGETKS
ncbi:MAG: HEAT repeat domain-containing protein [Methanomicrobiales archaeon]|nr:HEAT repeat domain-containing protein [Methanomicrobiales archaeon]